MKILFKAICLLFICAAPLVLSAQNDSTAKATISFIRQTGYNGSALHFHCFIDDTLVCNLRNKHYSIHQVTPGEHKINVTVYSKTLKTDKNALTLTVEAGESYFIRILPEKAYSFAATLSILAVSESTAKPLLKKMKEATSCLD